MIRGVALVGLLVCFTADGAANPPVVAPKPKAPAGVAGCETCRFFSAGRARGSIVPVQDGPAFDPPAATPEPLPLPQDATPLPAAEVGPPATLEQALDRYLPEAKPGERAAWAEELRHLPFELARDILAARSRTGGPPSSFDHDAVEPTLPPQEEPTGPPSGRRTAARSGPASASGAATLTALRRAQAVLLHNLANADTPAFKRSRPVFSEAVGSDGLAAVAVRRVESQGELEETGRPFDFAVDGPGYFQVRRGEAVALTRRGTFRLDGEGNLVADFNGETWALQPPVRVPAEGIEVAVTGEGLVVCRLPGETPETTIGQIEFARPLDPTGLETVGDGLFAVTEAAGPVAAGLPAGGGFGNVRQGCLERSNVDLAAELEALDRLRTQITALQPFAVPVSPSPDDPAAIRAAEAPVWRPF